VDVARFRSHFNRSGTPSERWSLLIVLVSIGGGLVGGLVLAQRQLAFVPTAGLIVRIRSEERALLDGLGEQYRHFAATRRRLCPGVW
jgi:protein-S-isoprenylcysteine O-methyltransferase Ste14